MRLREAAAIVFAAAMAFGASSAATAEEASERLLSDLMANPAFSRLVPANRSPARLAVVGDMDIKNWRYERLSASVPKVPRALDTYTVQNCDSQSSLVAKGTLSGARTQTASLTTSRGWEVGAAVKFEIGFPLVGKTEWTFTGTYNESRATTDAQSQTIGAEHGYDSAALPRTEHDLQLVVLEESVEGLPYNFDLVISGPVRVYHDLTSLWLPKSRLSDAFIGSDEPTDAGRRDLPVCRAWHRGTYHPGKVVSGFCNITWGGEEIRKSQYQVLFNSSGLKISDKVYSGGDTDKDNGLIAGEESSRACNAGRADYQDCLEENPQQGKLYVCFAKHMVLLSDKGWHPGKLVRRDCMIGYGGGEWQKGEYKILTYDGDPEQSFVINLEDYLTLEQRTFQIEGKFSGSYAGKAKLIRGDSRPVDAQSCDAVAALNASSDSGNADTSPKSGQIVYQSASTAASRQRQPSGESSAAMESKPAVAGVVIAETVIEDGISKQRPIIRELRLESPRMFGDDVVAVQKALIERGYRLQLDGFYGDATERAVRRFQQANGIAADGVVGGNTGYWLGLAPGTAPLPHNLPRASPTTDTGA